MSHYQGREDLALVPDLLGLATTEGRAFLAFNHSIERDDVATAVKAGGTLAHSLLALRLFDEEEKPA